MTKRERFDSLFQWYGGDRWQLLRCQAIAESDLNPQAVSRVGAQGLCQFMPATFRELMGAADPFNPEASIQAQAVYMARLFRRFSETAQALAAYNWGQGNVSRVLTAHGDDWLAHCPAETQAYVARVLALRRAADAG